MKLKATKHYYSHLTEKKFNKPFGQPNTFYLLKFYTCPINEETMAHRDDVPCSGQ